MWSMIFPVLEFSTTETTYLLQCTSYCEGAMKPKLNTTDPIQIARWADVAENGNLSVKKGPLPIQMCSSDGTGRSLLKEDAFGADIIRFGPNEGVGNHTHIGSHILFTVSGQGFVEYNGVDHALEPGVCYLIPSMVDHAIKATTELILLVVGNDHRALDSPARLDVIEKENEDA